MLKDREYSYFLRLYNNPPTETYTYRGKSVVLI